ncbi:MAG TPA: non-canonical purine NTP pyrophosphatase, partial [Xanthobacteraceae bacterium]
MHNHRKITGRLVLATHNPGKLREMRDLLTPFGIDT